MAERGYWAGETAFIGAGYVKAYDYRYQFECPLWAVVAAGCVFPAVSAVRRRVRR